MATAAAAPRTTAEADHAQESGAAHAAAAAKRLHANVKAKTKPLRGRLDHHHRGARHAHDSVHPLTHPERSALLARTGIQPALLISQPGDAAEAEADRVADRVVAMKDPPAAPARALRGDLQRSPLVVQRAPARASAPPMPQPAAENVADAATETAVKAELSGGAPMAADVAGFFGRRFGANFGDVRIHTDDKAANLATRLGARAFTYGRHIFFNGGQYNPDSEDGTKLIAHELAHTIQQSAVIQLKEDAAAPPRVTSRSAPQAQRGIVSRALNWIADKANYIPGFRLFTIVIGVNPINMATVERSGANILRALIEFIPGGGLIVDALNNHGIFEKGGKFIEDQFRSLGMVGAAFRDALMEFIDSLSWSDVFHLGDVWDRAKRIFTAPVDKLISFGKGLVVGIAEIVKDAILKPLGRYAASIIPKFDMLAGVFGKNPISGESVSPANALIGGFMTLIGQQEIWENIQKSGAVGKAWNWFKGALSGALALVKTIPDRFISTLKSLTIFDIVTIVGAWGKFAKLFVGFVVDFGGWALKQVLKLLEIILEVVAPSVIPYLKKAGAAFNTIIKAPGRFIGFLVKAGKAGFNMFKTNILAHLQRGILDWLLGSLAGANLYIPKSFALLELLKFGLSVIGATWENVRAKLVAATNETTVKVLETTFDLVRTLVTEGPAAAWQQLLETLSNLKSMVMDAIIDYVKGKVIEIAIEKVLSFLTPAGAFIQALLAIYRTITFIVGKLQQIGAVVAALIDGIAAIAAGNIGPASAKVESVLARGLSLAINFLANFAGLGNVSKKVIEIINKIRKPVDNALDKLVTWIVAKAKALGKMLIGSDNKPVPPAQKDTPGDGELGESVAFEAGEESHRLWIKQSGESAHIMLASTPKLLTAHLSDFSGKAAKLKDADTKKKVTAAIGFVSPIATQIEADAKTAASKKIGAPDRDKLDKKIEVNEKKIRPQLKVILDGLGVNVPDKITQIPCTFIRGTGAALPANAGEYTRQLTRQQNQINAMSVHIWMERRRQFAVFSKQKDRKSLDDNARKAVRARITSAIAERLTYPINEPATTPAVRKVAKIEGAQMIVDAIWAGVASSTRYKGLSAGTALAKAADGMKGKAVLHEPDKVAGGRYDEIQDIGSGVVNSDIGANWGGVSFEPATAGRINIPNMVEQKIKAEMKSKKVTQALWRAVKMDLLLQ
ncbi:DUF4157 domain-containing protein [Sphingomonas sp.]|uniref:eCIS core domain-containing protein n=1 Tax=Sphingomonas sp. TaxID=28214 RepID=UPI0025CD7767|nr:DUF4157 domain-containing protein [Sphingomonas sp.]